MDGRVNIFQTAGRMPIQDGRDMTDWINFILGLLVVAGAAKSVEELQDSFEYAREKRTQITSSKVEVNRYNIEEKTNATN